jgi:hypothetical protein
MKVAINNPIQEELSKAPWFIASCRLPRSQFRRLMREKFPGSTRSKYMANCMTLYDRVQLALRMSA